ncbi:MAG TPA: hypothetical protein VHA30_03045 [Patescibacteria group bacterium]|nr:hypothetical protein [Patescibacteria group bacterium]
MAENISGEKDGELTWHEFLDKDEQRLRAEDLDWNSRRTGLDGLAHAGYSPETRLNNRADMALLGPVFTEFSKLSAESQDLIVERLQAAVDGGEKAETVMAQALDLLRQTAAFKQMGKEEGPEEPQPEPDRTPEEVVESMLRQFKKMRKGKTQPAKPEEVPSSEPEGPDLVQ